jgi:hypothetical protein
MNNEPIAWGWYDLEIKRFFPHWDEDLMENKEGCIPLYTHLANTLTDEEIKSEAKYFCHSYHSENPERLVLFARAILRKSQEK